MLTLQNLIEIVNKSSFFDKVWYEKTYPDVLFSGLPAAEHYLKIGVRLNRNPGPGFNSEGYTHTYPDVAKMGMNPLVHFEEHGRAKGFNPNFKIQTLSDRLQTNRTRIDVVVPVYNALEDVKLCLKSLADCETGFDLNVLVINDGSDDETTQWLQKACQELGNDHTEYKLIEHDKNKGYTKAVNTGLRASDAPYIVTQNSDTILTPFWADGLVRCLNSDPKLGIVGPLSNAASWQNVPELYAPEGGFAINTLPADVTPADMAAIVRQASRCIYPRTPFVNGFCFMIRREVIDAIGYMDEEAFPTGYGEENDFSIRAQDAGFTLAYADDTYVFHAKSKSFGTERRVALSKAGSEAIRNKHTVEKFSALVDLVKKTDQMDSIRARVKDGLARRSEPIVNSALDWVMKQKVLFLLPVSGGGGGVHSIVQEVVAMRRMGVHAKIAIRSETLSRFHKLYTDIPEVKDLFIGFNDATLLIIVAPYDVVVATIYNSVSLVKEIINSYPWIVPAYYAQDYEPLFFQEGTQEHQIAFDSYDLIPSAIVFAKTHWICTEIEKHHNARAFKVEPSIDHTVYFPPMTEKQNASLVITAMIRPETPRRGPGRTMELLHLLKNYYGENICIKVFGADPNSTEFLSLPRNFEFECLGILTRPQVAELLREADVFIDLSDYQAFGRTGLEAMACGAVSVAPKAGGTDEYAIDGVNALVVDSMDVGVCFKRLVSFLDDSEQISRLQLAAIRTASAYSPRRAAMSELLIFAQKVAEKKAAYKHNDRTTVCVIPALTSPPSSLTGSAYVRTILPYFQSALVRDWSVSLNEGGHLPAPGSFDIAIIQRDLSVSVQSSFDEWEKEWKLQGGKIIYEIDDDLLDSDALVSRGYPNDAKALARRVQSYAAAANVITVSTQHLASIFAEYRAKIRVVPNFIDAKLWKLGEVKNHSAASSSTKLTIGYVGTPTHNADLEIVTEAIKTVQKEFGVEIEIIGAFQSSKPLFGKRIGLPTNSIYPVFVDWLSKVTKWDIAIIPLHTNSFNLSKSNLKFLECGALGVAMVCSDNAEYRKVARHEGNCLLTENTTAAWVAAISRLVEDSDLRNQLAAQAYSDISSNLTIQKHASLYISVLKQTMESDNI